MMKNIGIWLMLMLLAGVMAACSGDTSESGGNEEAGASGDKVELRVSWWGNADRAEKYEEMLALYQEQNPHVSIQTETAGFGDYFDRLTTQAAGGNPPDIFSLHMLLYGSDFASFDILEPLDTYVEDGTINLDDWDQAVVDAGKVNGTLYGLSKGITLPATLVNSTKIEGLGMELPTNPMSYEELMEYGKKLREVLPEDEYVINDASANWDHGLETFVRQKGKSFLEPDSSALGFEKEDLKEWWSYWEEMRQLGIAPPPAITAEEGGQSIQEDTLIIQGKTVLYTTNANQASQFQGYTDDELLMYRWATMPDGEYLSGENLQASAFVINKNSKHKEEAAKLINWFVNDVEAQKIYNAEIGVPSSKKVKDAIVDGLDPLTAESFTHMEEVGKDIPPTDTRPAGSVEVHEMLDLHRDKIAFGEMTVDEAVDAAFKEAEKILK